MFTDFFSKNFYGNSLGEWIIAALIILSVLGFAKFIYWLFSRIIRKLTSKTKTKLDDIIVDKVEEPVIFAFVIAGIWYALSFLHKGEGMTKFMDKVYFVLIVYNITWMVVRLFDALVEEYITPLVLKSENSFDDQLLPIFRKGSKVALWFIGTILALNNAGYDVGALLAGLGIGGLAFALAAQDLIKNLFGGLTIFLDKPFRVGDRIVVAGFDGFVEEIGIRSLRIRTLAGRQIIIPNSNVANDSIENISSEPTRKVVQPLGLTYDMTDEQIQKAKELLTEIAENHEKVAYKVLPFGSPSDTPRTKNYLVAFQGFGNFSLDILFVYYIVPGSDYLAVQNDINFLILRAFKAHGLEFAFPTQTIITQKA